MNVIIIGDGKVGFTLAEQLSYDESNAVTIIDKNANALRHTMERLDVRCLKGNGASAEVLKNAGIEEADLLIAATSMDEMNMVCALTGKTLGARQTIARIRDPEYANEVDRLKEVFGLSMVINPEQALAGEIVKMLEYPNAAQVEMFAKGRVELLEIPVAEGGGLAYMSMRRIAKRISRDILIGAVLRDGAAIIPKGDFLLLPGDKIYVLGRHARVSAFCRKIGIKQDKMHDVMLVGGGRVAYYLAHYLDEIGVKVKVVEQDSARCQLLAELLPRAVIIAGDGSDESVLMEEQLSEMDGFAALTGMDEENLMAALIAERAGVPRTVAKINRQNYIDILGAKGVKNLVSPKEITVNYILRYVRGLKNAVGNPVDALYRIVDDQLEAIEIYVEHPVRILDIPLKKLDIADNVLVAVIVRGNTVIIPHGDDSVQLHDRVILFAARGMEIANLDDILLPVLDDTLGEELPL
ncbi:MAG: Trk system potassium transporter TrkA [Oscillospiraceae bacterium]|jgi:trk system potassium uptake protein TrkA|nr:Trk system potassium transporter TrkA [Oscillospiraceae bacterium]